MRSADAGTRPGSPRLRIALDTSYAGTNATGVGLYSRRLAEALRALAPLHGVRLDCFGPACCSPPESKARPTDIAQEWPTYTQGVLPLLLRLSRSQVVHSTSHIGPLWGPGRLVVTVHDLIFLRRPQDYDRAWLALTRALLLRVLRRAAAIACDSRATRDDVVCRLGVPRAKTVVIYPGVDGQFARATPSSPLPYPYILCLGPWVKRKNLEVVVRAFASLAREHPDTRLVITGGPAPGVQSYTEEELTGLLPDGLRHRLVLPRFVAREALAVWVGGARVLAYPSVDEGFGLPPLEAMAAGVPVVVADVPAVVEATGGAALIAPKHDPAAWAVRLSLVLERSQVAEHLRTAGLLHSGRFTWEACASSFLRLYVRVASRSVRKQSA